MCATAASEDNRTGQVEDEHSLEKETAPNKDSECFVEPEKDERSAKDQSVAEAAINTCRVNDDEEDKYLHGFILKILTLALMAAVFMVALDNSIISTAIPKITTEFNSLDDVGWYGSGYLLTQLSLQPFFGRVYTFFNTKWTYVSALLIFEVGSVICAVAPNSTTFIIGRAVAGVGASGVFSGFLTIIGMTVTMRKRPLYMAVVSSMYGIASVTGPLLGGLMTDAPRLTWRFCFWINLPFGFIAIAITLFIFRPPLPHHANLSLQQKLIRLDFLGASLLISAIVCLLLVLQWGGAVYPWSNSKVWGCLLGFGLILCIFIFLQFRKGEGAMIPMRIISQRTIALNALFIFFLQVGMMAQAYYIPFYFQAVKGTSASESGIRTLAYGITITLFTIGSGFAITRLGIYVPFMWVGSALFTIGVGLTYTWTASSTAAQWLGYQILAGTGYGITTQVPFIAVQVVLAPEDLSTGGALIVFFQCLGGALGLSIAQSIFSNSLDRQLESIPGVDAKAVIAVGATNLAGKVPAAYLEAIIEAYNFALTRAFILGVAAAAAAFGCSLVVERKRIPKEGPGATAAGDV